VGEGILLEIISHVIDVTKYERNRANLLSQNWIYILMGWGAALGDLRAARAKVSLFDVPSIDSRSLIREASATTIVHEDEAA
jgi:hypothetical protein